MRNYHTGSMRQGGAMELRFLIYAFQMATSSPEAMRDPDLRRVLEDARRDVTEWLGRAPLRPGASPLRHLPSYERWVLDVLYQGEYDAYWQQPGYSVEPFQAQHADVPIAFLTGWYDSYSRASTENYTAFACANRGPARLIVGPWTHGVASMHQPWSGDVEFGPDAAMDSYDDVRLCFFDRHLKGLETGEDAPVSIFVMGGGSGQRNAEGRLVHGGQWRVEHEWPLARARATAYYLHESGLLSTNPPQDAASWTTYRFDPAWPVPTIGGNISVGYEIMPGGGFDQRCRPGVFGCSDHLPLAQRSDVLVFETEPLDQAVEVTGAIEVRLWISSSAVDTDFTAKLLDVYPPNPDYPDGYALNLVDSIQRARYRDSVTEPALLQPGEACELRIQLYPTSNLFAAGHRIRLDVSSSNFPRFDVNPNTGEPLGRSRRTVVADNTVYHNRQRPSHVLLPVVASEP
jgi:putative CocE/NonD family hydrolase